MEKLTVFTTCEATYYHACQISKHTFCAYIDIVSHALEGKYSSLSARIPKRNMRLYAQDAVTGDMSATRVRPCSRHTCGLVSRLWPRMTRWSWLEELGIIAPIPQAAQYSGLGMRAPPSTFVQRQVVARRAGQAMSDGTRRAPVLIYDQDTLITPPTGSVKRGLTHLVPQRTTFASYSPRTTLVIGNMFRLPLTPQHQRESQGYLQTPS